ncbi:MAG: multicopper oxidase family protein [Rhodothermales bacterium]|nr:multicopper oxidase family protein [Rhodothermales bacterium]
MLAFAGLAFCSNRSYAQEDRSRTSSQTPEPCEIGPLTEAGYPNIYCFDLIPTPQARGVVGRVDLLRPESPFTVAVDRDGMHRYRIKIDLENLPDPATFGVGYETYIAWLTTPELRLVAKLGEVKNGSQVVGEVSLNKYIILISAEENSAVEQRSGKLVLRALSPSSLMEAHDLAILSPVAVLRSADIQNENTMHHNHGDQWRMPPGHPDIQMAPGMHSLKPQGRPYLPSDTGQIPLASEQETVSLSDGDTLRLSTGRVRKSINEKELILFGFNGQFPGPRLDVDKGATITVEFYNGLDWPTAIHWHGIRLDNQFDGVPGLTQEPVQQGETFTYKIVFPDAGIYWYHPHHREDIQQDLGLYGNMLVDSEGFLDEVEVEDVLLIDDILLDESGVIAYGRDEANFALMGRFGNTILVNGDPAYSLDVKQGNRVRLFLTNTSNTRVFNLSLPGLAMKVIASDVSKYERESWVENVVIAPAERYVVELQFTTAGNVPLVNRVQGINHLSGVFFQESDTLGFVNVEASEYSFDEAEHLALEENVDVVADIDDYRDFFDVPPEKELLLTLEVEGLDPVVSQLMQLDPVFFNPVEWSGTMQMMNWQSSTSQVRWILRDRKTGEDNADIAWSFETSDVVKIRLHNDRDAFHAMQHPLHLHGQRFLVLEQDGVRNTNLVWKDTILLPVGSTADILLDVSNPGKWMIHCHIAEHLEAGMKMVFTVDGESTVPNHK